MQLKAKCKRENRDHTVSPFGSKRDLINEARIIGHNEISKSMKN